MNEYENEYIGDGVPYWQRAIDLNDAVAKAVQHALLFPRDTVNIVHNGVLDIVVQRGWGYEDETSLADDLTAWLKARSWPVQP